MYELKDFNIITANTALMTNPISREAIEMAINYQFDQFEYNGFSDDITPPTPSELTVIIVPLLNDYLLMIKANDPASNIIMTDSLNAWIQTVKEDIDIHFIHTENCLIYYLIITRYASIITPSS